MHINLKIPKHKPRAYLGIFTAELDSKHRFTWNQKMPYIPTEGAVCFPKKVQK